MSITVSLYVENQVLYVNLNGELDHHTSDQLRSRLNTVMGESQIKHIVKISEWNGYGYWNETISFKGVRIIWSFKNY